MRFATIPQVASEQLVQVKTVHKWARRHSEFPPKQTCPCCGHHPVIEREPLAEWLEETGRQ